MYKVKYYNRDKMIGKETFPDLEKAEASIFDSPYANRADYYEIIDYFTDKIVQEFAFPELDLETDKNPFQKKRGRNFLDWPKDEF